MFTLQDIQNNRVWIIGDTHFGHDGIVHHSFRAGWQLHGSPSYERHNAELVQHWNERVSPNDFVLHVGDVARSPEAVERWCAHLHGRVFVIPGNHDDRDTLDKLREIGWTVIKSLRIEWEGPVNTRSPKQGMARITADCTHYPLTMLPKGHVNFHGHTHGNPSGTTGHRHWDFSMENTGGYPRPLRHCLDKGVWMVHAPKSGKDRSKAEAAVLVELNRNVLK